MNLKYRNSHRWCYLNKFFCKTLQLFTGKHLCWSLFLIKLQASRLATLLKRDSYTGVFLWILQTLRAPISKNIYGQLLLIVVIYCRENWIKLFGNQIGLLFLLKHKITLFYLLSFVFIRFITCHHFLSRTVFFCYSLSFAVTCCHSWSFVVCHLMYYSLSLIVTCCTTVCYLLYHLLSFILPLFLIYCHSMYHLSVFL